MPAQSPISLADDGNYELIFNPVTGFYYAGCRRFTGEEALEHWSKTLESCREALDNCTCSGCERIALKSFERAKLFKAAILAFDPSLPNDE